MSEDVRASIKIVSVLACEDIREEADGKLMAIGILAPIFDIAVERPTKPTETPLPITLHFLMVVDMIRAGDAELRFRLKARNRPTGRIRRKRITVTNPANKVPMPLGPFHFTPRPGDDGFVLQYEQEGRWRTVGEWRYGQPVPDYESAT